MKIFPIKQRDGSACGPTSIQMVLAYFGLAHSFEKIAKISRYRKKGGLYNRDLVKTLQLLDFIVREKANATWADLTRFNTTDKVIIVSWMKKGYVGHFSIVDSVESDHIVLIDPEEGRACKIAKNIFLRLWMDYDDIRGLYPVKNTDIQLRWMCIVSKKDIKKARGG